MIRRTEIMSKTLGKWNTLKAQEKKKSLDAKARTRTERRGHMADG